MLRNWDILIWLKRLLGETAYIRLMNAGFYLEPKTVYNQFLIVSLMTDYSVVFYDITVLSNLNAG